MVESTGISSKFGPDLAGMVSGRDCGEIWRIGRTKVNGGGKRSIAR